MSHEWLCCWWESFGTNNDIVCLLLRDSDGPFCVASFVMREMGLAGISFPILKLLSNELSPRASVVAARDEEVAWQAIWSTMLKRQWAFLDHGIGPCGDSFIPRTKNSPLLQPVLREEMQVPLINLHANWDAWLASKERKFRKNMRSAFRRTEAYRATAYYGDIGELPSFIAAIEEVVGQSWSYTEGTSFIRADDENVFIRSLMNSYSEGDRLIAVLLYDDLVPVAFGFGVCFGERIFGLKTSYREDYAKDSVGMRVMAEFVQACIARDESKLLDMDCITEHGEYKRHWADFFEIVGTHRVFRRRLFPIMLSLVYRLHKYLERRRSSK